MAPADPRVPARPGHPDHRARPPGRPQQPAAGLGPALRRGTGPPTHFLYGPVRTKLIKPYGPVNSPRRPAGALTLTMHAAADRDAGPALNRRLATRERANSRG